MTKQTLKIVYAASNGGRGRPRHETVRAEIPVRRGPLSGRINELLAKFVPEGAKVIKHEIETVQA